MRTISLVTALALVAAGAARADVTVYDNEADFIANAPPVVTTTFDNLPNFQVRGMLELNGMQLNTQGIWQMPGICSANRSLGANSIARRHIGFIKPNGAESSVRAFGLLVTTIAISPPGDYQATVFTADGQTMVVDIFGVTFEQPAYRGFVSSSPITDLIITAVGGSQINFCFDDVSHSALR